MNNINFSDWIEKALEKGLTDIQIYATKNSSLSIDVYDSKVEKNEISSTSSLILKGIYNEKLVSARLEKIELESFLKMIDYMIDGALNITANEPAVIFEGSNDYQVVSSSIFDFSSVLPLDKVNVLYEIEKGIKQNEFLDKVETVSYQEAETKTIIVNSKGLNLSRHNTYATLYAVGIYKKNDKIKTGMSYQIIKDFKDIDILKLINDNITEGTGQLDAVTIPSSKYPVVFSNEMFGNILSEYLDIYTAEAKYRKLTKLEGKENEVIASKIVNLIDDPFYEKALFKIPFDDEGVSCKKRYWIKEGKFTDFAHNLKTAKIYNKESTGNGFNSGISPTNIYLEPSNNTLDEVIKTIKEGIYIKDLVGLHAGIESVSGNFSLQAAGFKIKDGKIAHPVDMIVVSGNYFDLLKNIEMIADDFIFGLSGVGTASVKIKELSIAGE